MRFEKGHKAETRRHILDVASRRFRQDGIDGSGIAGIMKEAGLTNGAFYPHFASKAELVREALSVSLEGQRERLEGSPEESRSLERIVRSYLGLRHLKHPETGCPLAALLPEISRQPHETRQSFEAEADRYITALAGHLPGAGTPAAKERATAIFALMVGTLQLARAVADEAHAEHILAGGVEAALLLASE